MESLLEQLAADPWGRLALHYVATGGLWNAFTTLLVICRLAGLFVVAPYFTSQSVPFSMRVGFVIVFSLIISPSLSAWNAAADVVTQASHQTYAPNQIPESIPDLICLIASEVGLGCFLGIGLIAVFSGVKLGGEWLERYSGLNPGNVLDPAWSGGGSAIGTAVELLVLVAFLTLDAIGGHWQLVQLLIQSFQEIPPGSVAWSTSLTEIVAGVVQQSMILGLRIATPLVATMMLVDVMLAFASRGTPASISSSGTPRKYVVKRNMENGVPRAA